MSNTKFPEPPFEISTVHDVKLTITKIRDDGWLEGQNEGGCIYTCAPDYVNINTLVKTRPSSQPTTVDAGCVAFAQWLLQNDFRPFPTENPTTWLKSGSSISISTNALYRKYIKELPAPLYSVDTGGKELPKEAEIYLDSKMRDYHNRLSYRAGAIELWNYLQAQPPSEAGMSQEEEEPLEMIMLLENHGNKMEVHCPDEDDEMTITIIDEDAGEPCNYSLTLDEAEMVALYLVRHVNNSKNAALPFGEWLDKYCDPHIPASKSTPQGEVPEEIMEWMKEWVESQGFTNDGQKKFASIGLVAAYHKLQEEIKQVVDNAEAFSRLSVQQRNEIQDYRKALQNFVDKVERGEARSERSYAEMKEVLAKYSPKVQEGGK